MEYQHVDQRTVWRHLLFAGLLLLALLSTNLGGRELWTDEEFSLAAQGPLRHVAFGDASHPPLYPVLLHFWLNARQPLERLRPSELDGWLRLFSIPWALLAWWLGWLIAARLNLKRAGLIAAWLMALSPLLMTYFRLGRYYSMAAALTMLCLYLLVRAWQRPGCLPALLLAVAAALTSYTDYIASLLVFALIGISAVQTLIHGHKRLFGCLMGAGVTAAVLLYPLLWMTVAKAAHVSLIPADPLSGSLWGFGVKLALPIFSLATGECIDPWRWWITVPAVLITTLFLAKGAWTLVMASGGSDAMVTCPGDEVEPIEELPLYKKLERRKAHLPENPPLPEHGVCHRGINLLIALVWPLNVLIGAVMMSTVAANIPPNRITSFAMFTIPVAYLVLARGKTATRPRWLAWSLLVVLTLTYCYGLWNYTHKDQLLNQGFAPPWRIVAQIIESQEQPDDMIVSVEDAFGRYYGGQAWVEHEPMLRRLIAGREPFRHRIWLITRDRGSQEMLELGLALRRKLLAEGATEQVWPVLPRTPEEQRMLSLVLRRPAWDAYVKVYLFERRESGSRNRES